MEHANQQDGEEDDLDRDEEEKTEEGVGKYLPHEKDEEEEETEGKGKEYMDNSYWKIPV